jgi:hypothetical protein
LLHTVGHNVKEALMNTLKSTITKALLAAAPIAFFIIETAPRGHG